MSEPRNPNSHPVSFSIAEAYGVRSRAPFGQMVRIRDLMAPFKITSMELDIMGMRAASYYTVHEEHAIELDLRFN